CWGARISIATTWWWAQRRKTCWHGGTSRSARTSPFSCSRTPARNTRSRAPGYHGFSFHAAPDVSLEDDLARRDLTIHAMARDEAGALVDPYGGAKDLRDRVLRHVSPAFAEDP